LSGGGYLDILQKTLQQSLAIDGEKVMHVGSSLTYEMLSQTSEC
jgi:hypothetical protein